MKLRNFNLEDVFGSNDLEQAKAYIGKKGYYADCIEDLDDFNNAVEKAKEEK